MVVGDRRGDGDDHDEDEGGDVDDDRIKSDGWRSDRAISSMPAVLTVELMLMKTTTKTMIIVVTVVSQLHCFFGCALSNEGLSRCCTAADSPNDTG